MDSPLSPIIANLYMESFERKALTSAPLTPTLWLRYVDNTFALWPHGQEQLVEFHNQLDSTPKYSSQESTTTSVYMDV